MDRDLEYGRSDQHHFATIQQNSRSLRLEAPVLGPCWYNLEPNGFGVRLR